MTTTAVEPCGSWRVVEVVEGMASKVTWCPRVSGPCPFRGTTEDQGSKYKCADSPGRRLAVVYSDERIDSARKRLTTMVEGLDGGPVEDALWVGIAAIDACMGTPGR